MNVLIIDDERSMTDAIRDRLADLSERGKTLGSPGCFCANDFYRAREYLDQKIPFDLIISDLLMPPRGLPKFPERDPGTMLNGWNFIYYYILRDDGKYHEDCHDTKIIFFSAFRDRLERYLIAKKLTSYWKSFIFVDKGHIYNGSGGFDVLMSTVEKLYKQLTD